MENEAIQRDKRIKSNEVKELCNKMIARLKADNCANADILRAAGVLLYHGDNFSKYVLASHLIDLLEETASNRVKTISIDE